MCKNKHEAIVGAEKEVLEVWAAYFKVLLNPKVNRIASERSIYYGPENNNTVAPTLQETLGVI
jgi:hypothetical protein